MSDHDAVTRVLHTMSMDGWASEDSGDVESPTGWFAWLYNDRRDCEALIDAFGTDLEEEGVDVADLIGGWVLYCDSHGNRDAVEYTSERAARLAYDSLCDEYGEWLAAADEDYDTGAEIDADAA